MEQEKKETVTAEENDTVACDSQRLVDLGSAVNRSERGNI